MKFTVKMDSKTLITPQMERPENNNPKSTAIIPKTNAVPKVNFSLNFAKNFFIIIP
ncbi:hypothetical protein [Mesomycoplasma lagogenitalium]|uniref:Uncharacterized protein n=1 Tax=Mesomycoplasma lagogenitalium TaxID=171286 RepID=A0ABY8LU55_9BACT|nr:hypothetical protein [Mesomycoplasma lagogenitalium]WGI36767.1 hypothetical protein QEG99_00555 [Mesomycoplasma lagogenitalium]